MPHSFGIQPTRNLISLLSLHTSRIPKVRPPRWLRAEAEAETLQSPTQIISFMCETICECLEERWRAVQKSFFTSPGPWGVLGRLPQWLLVIEAWYLGMHLIFYFALLFIFTWLKNPTNSRFQALLVHFIRAGFFMRSYNHMRFFRFRFVCVVMWPQAFGLRL